jgi:hypothetical protein
MITYTSMALCRKHPKPIDCLFDDGIISEVESNMAATSKKCFPHVLVHGEEFVRIEFPTKAFL